MSTFARSALVAAVGLLAAGCGSHVPAAPIGLGVPDGYRTLHVWRARLSAGTVADVVVTSAGPPVTSFGFHSADLRVLVWDPIARQWTVAFDAQKVVSPHLWVDAGTTNGGPGDLGRTTPDDQTPLLDQRAQVTITRVAFAPVLGAKRRQLVFEASSNYGGSGVPGVLAVVDFERGLANVVWAWHGEGLVSWRAGERQLDARAWYWTPSDAHCCPLRTYRFAVRPSHGFLSESFDDRPWLGVTVKELGPTRLRVTELGDSSPARGLLRVGDVLTGVAGAPKLRKYMLHSVYNEVDSLRAGDVARLRVQRGRRRLIVPVKLGSMRDDLDPSYLPESDYTLNAL